MPGEAPYREPTPLIPFENKETSLKCGRQPAKYLLIYILFLIPLK